jgi:hypothetical protein
VAYITHPAAAALGDQSFAVRLTSDSPAGALITDLVYVRVGDFILQVGDTTIGDANPDLSGSIVQQALLDFQAAHLTP